MRPEGIGEPGSRWARSHSLLRQRSFTSSFHAQIGKQTRITEDHLWHLKMSPGVKSLLIRPVRLIE